METNKLVAGIVAAAIAVIVLAGVLMPALGNASDSLTKTNTNDYGIFAAVGNEDLTLSCAINSDDSTKFDWTVNGETTTYPIAPAKVILMTDGINVIFSGDGYMIISTVSNARFTNQVTFSATLSEGSLTATSADSNNSSHNYTSSYDWAFYASESGDYRSFYLQTNDKFDIYYTDLNDIYGSNFTFTTNKFFSFHGKDVKYNGTDLTATVNEENVKGTQDMKVITFARSNSDYSFVVDNNGTEYTVSPWSVIVPYSVSSDTVQNPDVYRSIYAVIPILIIVAILLGVVAAFIVRRY